MSIFRWNKKKNDISGAEMIEIAVAVKKALENLGYRVEFKMTARGLKIYPYKVNKERVDDKA